MVPLAIVHRGQYRPRGRVIRLAGPHAPQSEPACQLGDAHGPAGLEVHSPPPPIMAKEQRACSYDVEIRTVICSTNAIESLNARNRRAVKVRGHFPTE